MDLPQGLDTETMHMLGQVLHHAMDGTLKLVALRTAAKQDLRAQVTTIQSRNNNPVKFAPDAGSAIEQLLQPARGFMVGRAAMIDAMDDLVGHASGTMSGMRAALSGALQRFEPKLLESKLSSSTMLDTLLPMNRRAKLWELYLEHHQRIQNEAEEDFHEVFGKAFMKAYDEQIERLRTERKK
jgi:FHA domain-containing protein